MTQNSQRIRPTQSFTLRRENLKKLNDAAERSGMKKSTILDDILGLSDVELYLRSLARRPSSVLRRDEDTM